MLNDERMLEEDKLLTCDSDSAFVFMVSPEN